MENVCGRFFALPLGPKWTTETPLGWRGRASMGLLLLVGLENRLGAWLSVAVVCADLPGRGSRRLALLGGA